MSEPRPPRARTPGEGPPVVGVQEPTSAHQPHSQEHSSSHSRWNWLAPLPIIFALVFYFVPTIRTEYEARYGYGHIANYQLATNILDQFRMHDLNGDGKIDPYEFANLLQTGILGTVNMSEIVSEFVYRDFELGPDKEAVTITVDFEPIVLETMLKFKDQTKYYFGAPEKILPGLIRWKTPNKKLQTYGAGNFKSFMPPDLNFPIGDTYDLVEPLPMNTPGIHMYRYHPLPPSPKEAFLFTLLTQFHPNVFVQNRFGPRGSKAIVRAKNGRYLDIVMRIHAEYQLNDEPNRQFWFTPAQYTGRLIIDREAQHVEFFELYLPTNKQLNIDMEWITGESTNEVDIGFVPEMRLRSLNPSAVLQNNSEVVMNSGNYNFNAIKWDEEISLDRALVLLEQGFYPFKKIPYLYFTNAMDLARQQEKLVHFILLWGALDDQSCCGSGRTLRDGPLGCSPVTTVLDSSYISSWALVNDIEDLIKNTSATEEHRKFGRLAMEAYKFPVESMVIRPTDGTVVHRVNANDLLHGGESPSNETKSMFGAMSDPLCQAYEGFLLEGKRKSVEATI